MLLQCGFALDNLRDMLGREARLADLTDDTVTRLVIWLRDVRGLHPRTVNDRRGRINALWRWLANRGIVSTRPTNCALPVPAAAPQAWSVDELTRLLLACRDYPGTIGGRPASLFWMQFHALAWDTAARTTELLRLRWEWCDRSGVIRVPAAVRKGKSRDGVYRLQPDALALVDLSRQPEGLILGWDYCESRFYQLYTELLRRAGLPAGRYNKPQKMRRSHASWLAYAGGDATVSLGHLDPATTRRAYLDPAVCAPVASARLPFRFLSLATPETHQ